MSVMYYIKYILVLAPLVPISAGLFCLAAIFLMLINVRLVTSSCVFASTACKNVALAFILLLTKAAIKHKCISLKFGLYKESPKANLGIFNTMSIHRQMFWRDTMDRLPSNLKSFVVL